MAVLVCMLLVWPVCLVRNEVSDRSGDEGHGITEVLEPGVSFTQYFQPRESYLSYIDFVLTFDENLPREGELFFEVINEKQESIYTGRIPYGIIINYNYYRVPVDLKLRKDKIYAYRVTNTDITENMPQVVYSEKEEMHAAENCGMLFGETEINGEALTQYTWREPLNLLNVAAIWSFLAFAGFVAAEIVNWISGNCETI